MKLKDRIKHPTFVAIQHSTSAKLTMRPFQVKEEKILLMAKENANKDIGAVLNAMTQIVNNCLIQPRIDLEKVPVFDIEKLFLDVYSQSVTNVVRRNIYEDENDEKGVPIEIDLRKVTLKEVPDNKVKVNDEMIVFLKYPDVKTIIEVNTGASTADKTYRILSKLVDKVAVDDEMLVAGVDFDDEEGSEFFETLPLSAKKKIDEFLDKMPQLEYTIKYRNQAGEDKERQFKGFGDFFS